MNFLENIYVVTQYSIFEAEQYIVRTLYFHCIYISATVNGLNHETVVQLWSNHCII